MIVFSLILQMLLSSQKLYQKYAATPVEEEVTDEDLIKNKLINEIDADMKLIDIDVFNGILKGIHDAFGFVRPNIQWIQLSECLYRIQPIIENVRVLIQYFIKLKTTVYRNTCKMAYLLFGISNEMAVKVSFYLYIRS